MAEDRATIRCVVCGRGIEVCTCCHGDDCPEPICLPDLQVSLGSSARQPHEHGG